MTKSTIFALIVLILTGNGFLHAQDFIYAKGLKNPLPLGGDVVSLSIKADRSGNTYVAGYFSGTADFDPGAGEAIMVAKIRQLFLARYDSSGNFMFARAIGGTEAVSGTDIAIDRLNNVYMTGTFSGTADFDPGSGTASFTSAGGTDAFIARYDSTGSYVGAKALGSTGSDQANSIAIDSTGNMYICGFFQITIDSASTKVSAIIAKYDSSFRYIFAVPLGSISNIVHADDIAVDGQANIYITGQGFANRQYQIFIAKYEATGKQAYATYISSFFFIYGQGIAVDETGNAYVTGQYASDVYLAKFDPLGKALFTKYIGGSGMDAGASLELDGKGHLYVTGFFRLLTDFDPGTGTAALSSAGGSDIFVAGYDTAGNYLSAYAQGGKGDDAGRSIAVHETGDLFVTGTFSGRADFNPGPDSAVLHIDGSGYNTFVSRTSKEGIYKWADQLGTYSSTLLYDRGRSIAIDAQGNTYITGMFAGTLDFDPGSGVEILTSAGVSDAFFAKYDNQGNYLFAKAIGGVTGEEGLGIALDDSGCIYIVGIFSGKADFDPGADSVFLINTGSIDMFLAKYSASGDYIYAKSVGGQKGSYTRGYSITVDKTGNTFICGSFSGNTDFDPGPDTAMLITTGETNTFFLRYDAQGNYVFAKSFVSFSLNTGFDIATDSLHNIYVTGSFYALTDFDPGSGRAYLSSAGYSDIFFAKYDQAGNYIYAKRMGSAGSDYGSGIAVDGSGNVFLTGTFENTVDFDPDPADSANLIAAGRSDIFVAKYNPEGSYVYAKAVGGIEDEDSPHISSDGLGNVYVTGTYQGTADFDPGSGSVNFTSTGGNDIFIAKYDNNGNYVYARTMGSTAVTEYGYGIAADGSGNVYITGSIAGTANFNLGGDSSNSIITASNSDDIFFAKYGPRSALPVTLSAFKAEKVNNGMQVKVYWTATTQLNNDYFEVERSKDGVHFESISRVQGCTVCIDVQKYQYYDNHPLNGISYYRLKQADLDGKVFYSHIVTINNATKNSIVAEAFPSMSTGMFKIAIHDNKQKKQIVLQLIDGGGKLIKQQQVWLSEGNSIIDYNMASQASGMYYLRITNSNGTTLSTLKIMKK